MTCENNLCVYFQNNQCILEEITIDASGICAECIYVSLDEKILENARKLFLNNERL